MAAETARTARTTRTTEPDGAARVPPSQAEHRSTELRSGPNGLGAREAARRLVTAGPNVLPAPRGPGWPTALARQLVHPLALLLWAAAGLSALVGSPTLAAAIVAVVLLNAALAFWQEQHAEHAVAALEAYLPDRARVLRDGHPVDIAATDVVPGDVALVAEGDAIPADGRLLAGAVAVDMSTLTGESEPVERRAGTHPPAPPLEAPDLLFRGTTCLRGDGRIVVTGTGAHTEIGRIASLTRSVGTHRSPLEDQVRRVAWLIAGIGVGVAVAFVPVGLSAGLSPVAAAVFAVGLLVANVPEGLLPIITLALANAVRDLARRGAVVRRLSAVETLGATTTICTDKTGTLTENRQRVRELWLPDRGRVAPDAPPPELVEVVRRCSTADRPDDGSPPTGDPTELALLELASGTDTSAAARERDRIALHPFDAALARMTTVDHTDDGPAVHTKGSVEAVLPCCRDVPAGVATAAVALASDGLRVLALAHRPCAPGEDPTDRAGVEDGLTLVGLVALLDPPRPSVRPAVARCHAAGITVHVVTGDHPATAATIARSVGIGEHGLRVVTGPELTALDEPALDALLSRGEEIVFARVPPEAKLRVVEALVDLGEVVAVTGDGVNDAPALRRADIGVAMGRSGTDVARGAATMVLTDDDFATIVAAVEAGRRVYDNVRRFIVYIFAHAVPEVVPFLLFALSGGAIPPALGVLPILAIDLGTDTLPALALGREAAEPGLMDRPPRPRHEGVIRPAMLARAWGLFGTVSALLTSGAFLVLLLRAGWTPGAPVGPGSPWHLAWRQAATATFVGIVSCQVGVAVAARTEHAPLRSVGLFSNRALLGAIAVELAFTAALVYVPAAQAVVGTTALDPGVVAVLACFAPVVWGADALRRAWSRPISPPRPSPSSRRPRGRGRDSGTPTAR